ncbi:magnesium chelatase subunit D [Aestuariivirga sp.]|uniref:magnesium chelatase subunit D n=1 Tax=Aestuariivirga sp. TaxID=2650926 RepID=UPI0035AE00EB
MSEAALACALLALDPGGLKGAVIRGHADAFLATLRHLAQRRFHRVPPHIGIDRLTGSIDVAATLKSGTPVHDRGLLADADGLILLTSAERLPLDKAALIAAAMDHGAPFTVIAHDEGIDDERAPLILAERVAFLLDLTAYEALDIDISAARLLLPSVAIPDRITEGLCQIALALGLTSLRPAVMALRAARAAAALDGRREVDDDDAALAARLVLAPRAVTYPAAQEEEPEPPEPPAPQDSPEPNDEQDGAPTPQELADRLLDAVKASLPAGLLAALEKNLRQPGSRAGAGAVSQKAGLRRGRPAGTRQGEPKNGARLALVDTLRAAAPWQPLRRRGNPVRKGVHVEKQDFRIRRFKEKRETTAIFVVDASGSAALHRMAEAKGAVELLLADCYVRRDRTALIAVRGKQAELLLPPTRSLQRAKKSLAGLPGGGGTPLAAGIEQSMLVADQVRRAGGVPLVVFLTDGKANIARDGTADRAVALRDAEAAAKLMRLAGVRTLMIDLSETRTGPARKLAEAMGADYLPLPHADAARISASVNAMMQA